MTVDEYGSAQYGVVANHQALETLTPDQLETEIRKGRLVPHRRRVYRCWGAPESPEQNVMAAVLAVGLGFAFAYRLTAAWLHGIRGGRGGRIEILTVRAKKPVLQGIAVHTTNFLPLHHLTVVAGIPVTTVARTLVDLSSCYSHETWKRIVRRAVRQGLTSYDEVLKVREEMRARGRRRTTVVDEVLGTLVGAPGDSDGEAKLVQWLVEAGFRFLSSKRGSLRRPATGIAWISSTRNRRSIWNTTGYWTTQRRKVS